MQEVPVQGLSSFVILLVLPYVAFRYRETLVPLARKAYASFLSMKSGSSGSSFTPKQTGGSSSRSRRVVKETSQNEFDFLPPGLSGFAKSKQKTKTK